MKARAVTRETVEKDKKEAGQMTVLANTVTK